MPKRNNHPDHHDSTLTPSRLLAHYLRPARGRITLAIVTVILKDSPAWALPLVTAAIIDDLVAGNPSTALILPASLGLASLVVNGLMNAVYTWAWFGVVRRLASEVRNDLVARLQALSIGFHARSHSATVQTKVVRDVENVELMLQQSFNPLSGSITAFVGAGIATALRVPQFLIVFLFAVPLSVFLIRWLRSRTADSNATFRHQVEQMSARVGEMSSLLSFTRSHGLESVAVENVAKSAVRVRDAGFSLDRLNGRFAALSWNSYQALSLLCLVGAAIASATRVLPITVGEVVLMSTYFNTLTGSLNNAFSLAPIITKGGESLRSIGEVLQDPDLEQNEGKTVVDSVTGRISFDATSYDYGSGQVINEITLEVVPGETLAFVGPSGSGKSTMLNLALGLVRATSGRVLIDGQDVNELDMRSVRSHVSVVPQDPVLFGGSIRDNVAYGLMGIGESDIREALDRANASEFVDRLPNGWDTIVGERGSQLSGGQRQRIAIARALIRNPKILLLDEATSALDSESESLVRAALETIRRGRTTLVVAHRLSTVRSADRIVVLSSGTIAEIGSHEELLERHGAYRKLIEAQRL
jgi:ATP-binding cassette, subfamily B, bacterial